MLFWISSRELKRKEFDVRILSSTSLKAEALIWLEIVGNPMMDKL